MSDINLEKNQLNRTEPDPSKLDLLLKGFAILLYNDPNKVTNFNKFTGPTLAKSPLAMSVAVGIKSAFSEKFDALMEQFEKQDTTEIKEIGDVKIAIEKGIKVSSITSVVPIKLAEIDENLKTIFNTSNAGNAGGNQTSEILLQNNNDAIKVNIVNVSKEAAKILNSNGNNGTNGGVVETSNVFSELLDKLNNSTPGDIQSKLTEFKTIFGEKGAFAELIESLNKLKKVHQKVEDSVDIISDLMSVLNDLTEFGLIKTIKAKLAIKFISNLIIDDIENLLNDFIGVSNNIQAVDRNKLNALSNLIDTITSIGTKSEDKVLLTRVKIKVLRAIISKDYTKLVEDIEKLNVTDKVKENINAINGVIDNLLKIDKFKDYKQGDFEVAKAKVKILIDSYIDLGTYVLDELNRNDIEITKDIVDTITTNIRNINIINESIKTINSYITLKDIALLIANLILLYPMYNLLIANITKLKKLTLKRYFFGFDEFRFVDTTLSNVKQFLLKIKDINDATKLKILISILAKFKILQSSIKSLSELIEEINGLKTIHKVPMELFKSKDDKDGKLTIVIKGLVDIGKALENLKDINKLLKRLKTANLLVASIGKLLEVTGDKTFDLLGKQADQLKTVIDKYGNIKEKDIKQAKTAALAFLMLVSLTALGLAAGAAIMGFVKIENLLMFIVTFGTFMFLMSFIYKRFNKDSKLTMQGAQAFALLMVVSGGLMIAGALLFEEIDFMSLILFTVSLATFMLLMCLPFFLFKKIGGTVMQGAGEFALLLVAAGGLLIAGGLLFNDIDIIGAFKFIICVTLFMALLSLPLILFSSTGAGKSSMQGAGEVALLVIIAGALLVAGSYLFDAMFHGETTTEKWWNTAKSILFCILVGLFVLLLTSALNLNSSGVEHAMKVAKAVALLVIVAGALLIGGSYLLEMMFHGNTLTEQLLSGIKSIIFCFLVWLFIKLLVKAITKNAAGVTNALAIAGSVALLVIVAGGILLLAAYVLKGPEDIFKIIFFTIATIALVGGISFIVKLLNEASKAGGLRKGLIAMGVISGIIIILAAAMYILSAASKKVDLLKLVALVGIMTFVVLEMIAIVTAIGIAIAATAGVGALVATAGLATLAGLIAAIYMLADMMMYLTIVSSFISPQKKYEDFFNTTKFVLSSMEKLVKGDKDFKGIINLLNLKEILKLRFVLKALNELSVALSAIALALKDWIDLKIPIYNGMKQVGWITIDKNEFAKATNNISNAVISLLKPIDEILKFDKEGNYGLFEYSLLGGTKIKRVMKGLKMLGPVLSSIAEGVKDWATLKIPIYRGVKQTGWMTITSTHFSKASEHIANSIKALIDGVSQAYEQNKDVFEMDLANGFWGALGFRKSTNPMIRVLKTLQVMGPALSSIASGVKDWVDLKIPLYENGVKQTGWLTLGDAQFTIASTNIAKTVQALMEGVAEGGKKLQAAGLLIPEETITYKDGLLFGLISSSRTKTKASPIMTVMKSIAFMGMALSSVANGLKFWADIKIPTGFDKDDKPTGYMSMSDIKDKVPNTIKEVLVALGSAVATTYKQCPEVFNTEKGSPAYTVAMSINLISGAIASIAKVLAHLMAGKLQEYDKNGKPIGEMIDFSNELKDIQTNKENSKFAQVITTILTTFGSTIDSIYNNAKYKYIFRSGAQSKSIAENIGTSISAFTTAIKNVLNIITEFNKLEKEHPEANTESIEKTFDSTKEKIEKIISGVVELYGLFANPAQNSTRSTLGEFFKGKQTVADWINENIEPIQNAEKALKNYFTAVTSIYQQIGTLQAEWDKNKDAINKFNMFNPRTKKRYVTENIETILYTIIDIINIDEFATLSAQLTEEFNTKIANVQAIAKTIIDLFIDKKDGLYAKIAEFQNGIITACTALSEIKITNKKGKNVQQVTVIDKINEIFALYDNIISTTVSREDQIINKYDEQTLLNKTNAVVSNTVYVTKATEAIANLIEAYIKNLKTINTSTDNINENVIISNVDKLERIWSKIIEKIRAINSKLNENKDSNSSWFGSLFSSTEYGSLEDLIKIVNDLIGIYDDLKEMDDCETVFSSLATGISILDTIGKDLKGTENLKAHQEVFKRYVNTVNSISLAKFKTLYNFAEAMNRLADRFGNLDNLTDALGNKLTVVLTNLVKEMKTAEDVIKDADTLRAKRETLIKQSITEMKSIMNQHLVVDIYNQSTSQELPNENPGAGGDIPAEENPGTTGGGTTPQVDGPATTNSEPLLTNSTKSNSTQKFNSNIGDVNKQLSDSISNALNNSLRQIFKYNGKENQYILNLKNKR